MRIAVDAMGGDFAPEQPTVGARLAALDLAATVTLIGDVAAIEAVLAQHGGRPANLEIESAGDVIGMGESPRAALRGRDDSSMARAVTMVAEGRAQAAISAGNSGAFMALSAMRLGTIPGVRRPAIACVMPGPSGPHVLLDAGANADCKPEHLRDFGLMAHHAEHAHIQARAWGCSVSARERAAVMVNELPPADARGHRPDRGQRRACGGLR